MGTSDLGTTGAPKLVLHTLCEPDQRAQGVTRGDTPVTWSTFYDIRRYGGLQIYLRAPACGSLVLSQAAEPVDDFLGRVAAARCHAYLRHALALAQGAHERRSGADLPRLRAAVRRDRRPGRARPPAGRPIPQAIVAHAFASTEAGVAFEVRDGKAGFPATLIDAARAPGRR